MRARPFEGRNGSRALSRSRTFDVRILNHLTERDVQICIDLHEHRFMTTHQIFQLHFNSEYRARARTLQLFQLGLLNRFRPPKWPGSWPWHYVLDRLGLEVVSGALDIDFSKYFDRNRPSRLAKSRRLDHLRQVNDFFCHLAYAGRKSGDATLTRWLGEFRSAAECNRIVFPDGIATLRGPDASKKFFFELDRGTERDQVLKEKMIFYDNVAISQLLPRILLFCFSAERRERSALPLLYSSRLTVATATLDRHLQDPLAANWLPWRGERRLRILDLQEPSR